MVSRTSGLGFLPPAPCLRCRGLLKRKDWLSEENTPGYFPGFWFYVKQKVRKFQVENASGVRDIRGKQLKGGQEF